MAQNSDLTEHLKERAGRWVPLIVGLIIMERVDHSIRDVSSLCKEVFSKAFNEKRGRFTQVLTLAVL